MYFKLVQNYKLFPGMQKALVPFQFHDMTLMSGFWTHNTRQIWYAMKVEIQFSM